MKISKAIMAVDDNPLYSDFWAISSMIWKKRFNIDPVLIYCGEKEMDDTFGKVIKITPVSDIPTYFQAQWARFWFTTLSPDEVHIVSDIEMLPISKSVFVEQLVPVDDDKYVHLFGKHRPIPVCYHVAKGSMFKKVLQLGDSYEKSLREVYNSDGACFRHMGFERWGREESYCTKRIEEYQGTDLHFFQRLAPDSSERLDRSNWVSVGSLQELESFVDCHSLRPYHQYKSSIDKIAQLLTSECK